MSLTYFRFCLPEISNKDATVFSARDFGVIRHSWNLDDNSISILCDRQLSLEEQKIQWINYFKTENITFELQECGVLEEETRQAIHCAHDACAHEHHDHEHHDHHHEHDHAHHDHAHHSDNHWLKAGLGLLCGIGFLILSIASFNIPMIAYYALTGFSVLMTFYLGRTVYQSAWQAWKQKKWDMSSLYTISTFTIIGMSIASLFIPGLPMLLESAPLILGFWHLGEAIEHTLLEKINNNLDIRDCIAATYSTIPKEQLIPNDVIMLNASDVIPADGVLEHDAWLYTTRINGASSPKFFKKGDAVEQGMSLVPSQLPITMRVTKTYQNSYLSIIANKINQTKKEKAPVELFANTILNYFVPSLLAVAIVSGVVVGLFFPPAIAIQCVISVLVSACPCVLSIIIPTAVKIGMKKAAESGILYKDGKTLQQASDVDTVVFDLNGTLTQGDSCVDNMHILDDYRHDLPYFSLLEQRSSHPLANIIIDYINNQMIPVDQSSEITSLDTSHHSGVKGCIKGETYIIGNADMLHAHGIETSNADPTKGSIYMVKGCQIIGQIAINDPLRPDAIQTVKQLQAMGKNVHICTGADLTVAKRYADKLNIPHQSIRANATANEKETYILQLQQQKHIVCMVGDAINDGPAIARANIGVAIVSRIGHESIQHDASIVIQKGLLFPLVTALDVASKTTRNIIQNLSVSLTYNGVITLVAAGLFLAVGFTFNPAFGIGLMIVESAIVLANLQRLKYQPILSTPAVVPEETTTSQLLKSLGTSMDSGLKHATKPNWFPFLSFSQSDSLGEGQTYSKGIQISHTPF